MIRSYSKKYLAEFVYGATDGTVTTFAIISAISGAALSPALVLILGFSNVFADGLSMAASNYLSEKASQDLHGKRMKRKPIKTALATFVSFVVVGSFPVIPFAVLFRVSTVSPFIVSIVVTACMFLFIGYVRGYVSGVSPVRASCETLGIGLGASLVAFLIGALVKGIVV